LILSPGYSSIKSEMRLRSVYLSLPGFFLIVSGSQSAALPCASCHPAETRTYQITAMGRSIGAPDRVAAGDIDDEQSGAHIHTEWRSGKLMQRLSEDGLIAEYELRYQIGAGRVGHSYAVLARDFLLEAPASFYVRYGWDASPGYRGSELLDVNRVLTERCLFCHSNPPDVYREGRFAVDTLEPVSCERCHGETAAHLKAPSASNIVNPAKLAGRVRDSVCEQCHLEGVARVVNPGRSLTSFRPGTALEETLAIYVAGGGGANLNAVSQEEQLAQSRCAIESAGKLWCGTCHNPHSAAKDRSVEIRTVCQSCHPALSSKAHLRVTACVGCHMPQRAPKDVAHAALTDHRIRRRPESVPNMLERYDEIRAWAQPAPEAQSRDLGLGYVQAGSSAPPSESLAEKGIALLQALPDPLRSGDPEVAAALGSAALASKHDLQAIAFFERAVKLAPASAEYAMELGIARKESGDLDEAKRDLGRAIELDPSLERAYLEISAIASKQGHKEESASILDSYLQRNPQCVSIRLMRNTLELRKK
jgi:Flp pilus assembly protein TadD